MTRSWSILRVGAALAAVTGCATVDQVSPKPVRPSVPASAQPSASGPPAFYTGLSSECPILKSPQSVRFTGSRTGKHFPPPPNNEPFLWINCGWRPSSGEAPWVTVTVSLHLDPATAHEKAERRFALSRDFIMRRAEGIPSQAVQVVNRVTPSGSATFVADADDGEATGSADELSQTTLIGNAVVTVSLFEKREPTRGGSARADELMVGLAATSEAITAEVAGQLVSRA